MKFLLDQDVYTITARFLREIGHDVVLAAEVGLSRADDEKLLRESYAQGRILVTRDRDFGNLVFIKDVGSGVIYLRVLPSTLVKVHDELRKVLAVHSDDELANSFVVVNDKGYRIRRKKR